MLSLFDPISLGNIDLKHRIVLAPLTRIRADDGSVPLDIVTEYYSQRASVPGTLLITEGTFVSRRAGGRLNVPGIYTQEQIQAWRNVTGAVHAKGCYIYCQLWALGRAADPKVLEASGDRVVSSSDVPLTGDSTLPRPLTEEDIRGFITDYVVAAKNAIEAGFDGVEIHGANGYLPDQFLQDTCNRRSDDWGGSVDKRSRFGTELVAAVAAAIGPQRVGYRVSPWSPFQGMRMADPMPQFLNLADNLKPLGLAYLHIVEPRISGSQTIEASADHTDVLVNAWKAHGTVILAGGFTPESAQDRRKRYGDSSIAFAFGRAFLANPDLPFRISAGLPLNDYNRSTFYTPKDPIGYVDYPFSKEFLEMTARA
jgi:NADPH2 dehydrogenase